MWVLNRVRLASTCFVLTRVRGPQGGLLLGVRFVTNILAIRFLATGSFATKELVLGATIPVAYVLRILCFPFLCPCPFPCPLPFIPSLTQTSMVRFAQAVGGCRAGWGPAGTACAEAGGFSCSWSFPFPFAGSGGVAFGNAPLGEFPFSWSFPFPSGFHSPFPWPFRSHLFCNAVVFNWSSMINFGNSSSRLAHGNTILLQ